MDDRQVERALMIVPVGFLETSVLTAVLLSQHREALSDTGVLPLRGPLTGGPAADAAHIDLPLLEGWNSARAALIKIRNATGARTGKQATLGKAAIMKLEPGEWSDWRVDRNPYADAYMRLHVTLIPSENHRLLCGDASLSPAVGHVLCVDHRRPHSEINLGSCGWVQLVVDVRRGDAPDLPVDDPGGEADEPAE